MPMTRDLLSSAFAPAWAIYREKTTAPIPPAVANYAERFAELAPMAMDALSERSMLIHGDIRADNMFFSGGQLKVVDFQLAAKGGGATDIGYLVSQGLPTEVADTTKRWSASTSMDSQSTASPTIPSTRLGGTIVSRLPISLCCR